MLNRYTCSGRLVEDPELRKTPAGVSVCILRIAVQRDYKKEGQEKPESDFFDAEAWRATAEFISRNFTKGRMISLDGRLENDTWTDKETGKKRTKAVIRVDSAYFADSKPTDAQSGGGDYSAPGDTFEPEFN